MSRVMQVVMIVAVMMLCGAGALGTVRQTVGFTGVNSNGLQGSAANSVRTVNVTGGYLPGRIRLHGTLTSVNSSSFASDAYIRITSPDGASTTVRPFPTQGTFSSMAFDRYVVVPGAMASAGAWTFRFYEAVDNGGPSGVDARWDVVIDFTDDAPAPATFLELGEIAAPGVSFPNTPVDSTGYQLFRFVLNRTIRAEDGNYLDLVAATSGTSVDTELVLFDATGNFVGGDDDSGPGLAAQFSFGAPGRAAVGDGRALDGQNGVLSAGVYYLAVGNFDLTRTDQPWGLAFSGGQSWVAFSLSTNVAAGVECPGFVVQPAGVVAAAGTPVVLKANASGAGVSVRWMRGDADLVDGNGVFGTASSTLVILAAGSGDSGEYRLRATNACGTAVSEQAFVNVVCQSDFNGDGDFGTDADIEAFFACLAGACCETCGVSDFNADGDYGTDADIEAFFRVLGGGAC